MNSTVAILEQIVELFKEANNNEAVINKLNELSNKIEALSNSNTITNEDEKKPGPESDDPNEDDLYMAVSANISTSIAKNDSGIIDISSHSALAGNVTNIQIQANSLRSESILPNDVTSFEHISSTIGILNITPEMTASSPAGYAVIYNSSSIGLDGTAGPTSGIKIYSLRFTAIYAGSGRATPTKKIYIIINIHDNKN